MQALNKNDDDDDEDNDDDDCCTKLYAKEKVPAIHE